MKQALLLAVVAFMLVASPVMAKEGFYLGAFIPTNTIGGDAGKNVDSGTGWGLRTGVGFNRYVGIEARYSMTEHDITGASSADLKTFAGDIKLNFPLTSLDRAQIMTLEPYLLVGYAQHEMTTSPTGKGSGLEYGIGIELYLFRELSIQAGWTKSKPTFKVSGFPDVDGEVKTVDFGVIYHFI